MKYLELSNSNKKAIVDDDIWLRFCHYKWRLKKSARSEYVVRTKKIKKYYPLDHKWKWLSINLRLHREVMNCPENMEVHHKEGNPLDNRREMLEIVDPSKHSRDSANKRWTPPEHSKESKDNIPF